MARNKKTTYGRKNMLKTLQTSAEGRSEMIYPEYDTGHYNAAAQIIHYEKFPILSLMDTLKS